jgi:hypothetical protein
MRVRALRFPTIRGPRMKAAHPQFPGFRHDFQFD